MGLKRDNISSRYFKHTCVAFGFWLLSKVHDLKYVYTLFIPCMGDSRVLSFIFATLKSVSEMEL